MQLPPRGVNIAVLIRVSSVSLHHRMSEEIKETSSPASNAPGVFDLDVRRRAALYEIDK